MKRAGKARYALGVDYGTNSVRALIVDIHDGEPISPDHGGPARLVVPRLYAWKSAKWLRKLTFIADDQSGYWEQMGYHNHGDPWKEERYS